MKAILVINMPKNCAGCKFRFDICSAVDWEERPSWCPLKPMPQKMEESWMETPTDCDYRMGWNDCLEEISGENYVVQEEE